MNALSLNPLDVELSEHVLAQLDLEDQLTQDFCQLSLNALSCTDHGQAMKVSALVGNKVMLILIDSGSYTALLVLLFFRLLVLSLSQLQHSRSNWLVGRHLSLISWCHNWNGG